MTYLLEAIKPTRLYHKQCPHCGLNYLGKHTGENIESYSGSGVRWQKHLKKHGVEPIHIWHSDWFYDTSIVDYALGLSEKLNIVESKDWANAIPEDGLGNGGPTNKGRVLDQDWRQNIGASVSKTKNNPKWKETVGVLAVQKDRETKNNHEWIEKIGIPGWKKGGQLSIKTRQSKAWIEENYKTCEHCDTGPITPQNYAKWHGDNCKEVRPRKAVPILETIECLHCGKVGKDGSGMKRWHFDKCRERK